MLLVPWYPGVDKIGAWEEWNVLNFVLLLSENRRRKFAQYYTNKERR
jgi:hypothetical protein